MRKKKKDRYFHFLRRITNILASLISIKLNLINIKINNGKMHKEYIIHVYSICILYVYLKNIKLKNKSTFV